MIKLRSTMIRQRRGGMRRAAVAMAVLMVLAAATAAPAQTPAPAPPAPEAKPNTGRVSLSAGIDWTTDYYFRGILQEDDDYIFQPMAR